MYSAGAEAKPLLTSAWQEVRINATGATTIRVKLTLGGGSSSLEAFDPTGAPLFSVGSVVSREINPDGLRAIVPRADVGSLYSLDWIEIPDDARAGAAPSIDMIEFEELGFQCSADAARTARDACEGALALIKDRIADKTPGAGRLVLLTRGAIAAHAGEQPDLAAAAVWGLMRSAHAEHPDASPYDTDDSEASSAVFEKALAACATEPQLALREGRLLVPRVRPRREPGGALTVPAGAWALDKTTRGSLDSLALLPAPRALDPLGPGQVRIAIRAAGVSFRDVLSILDAYPGDPLVGAEGAGIVIEVGPGVEELVVGDSVVGLIPGAFGPWAVADASLLVRTPAGCSFEQAAALPVTQMTARFGLVDLAGLRAGERILIHAGAGGVGAAAIQLAQRLGAEVFATASPAKWGVLHELGLAEDHVASSRSLEFGGRFLQLTGGEGVDVVLNSLSGDFIDSSLALLPRGGRFLELGKTDVREPERVAEEHPGVSYRALDLSEAGSSRQREMLEEIAAATEDGPLSASPSTTRDVRDALDAFRDLSEGRNIGKVVLKIPGPIDPERTVLITGGTGGLGGLVAKHLIERHAARNLVLVSRKGSEAQGAAELCARLEQLGARVRIESCDISDRGQIEALLASIDTAHPLGAVIHAAGALADGMVETMEVEGLHTAFAPKVDGGWNLHELTKDLDLSAFVLFSSISGTLGGPGQANYAAANTFLDALARCRVAAGLPAISVAWGLWERESGMAGSLDDAGKARIRRRGLDALSDDQGLALLDAALFARAPDLLGVRFNRSALRNLAEADALPAILGALGPRIRRRAATASLAEQLSRLPADRHAAVVLDLVRASAAAVLGHSSAADVPVVQPFRELGFDSLAAVLLRNRLATTTGLQLPTTVAFDYPTVTALADYTLQQATQADDRNVVLESGEQEVREALASLPLARLRSAGLLDPLLRLANPEDHLDLEQKEDGDRIDAMDVKELLLASEEQAA